MKRSATTNTFTDGLVMDLNPLLTPNSVLTDCLNGTLITNNGNESVLLNDMGNGRVETAFLPEGYIPVGTCEFGDIIYIVSYNPLIDKCEVGCFPSPLRNIDSESLNDSNQSITNEFLEIKDGKLTGKIRQFSTRKIVYDNNMTSGDKYMIIAPGIADNQYLTDVGNTDHTQGSFPKLWKISVVSIEEDGKITKLDTGLKWYDWKNGETNFPYFLNSKTLNTKGDAKSDIDEYRSIVSSGYSIFSSKVSGKLGLLIELETITGFSCTWGLKNIGTETRQKYTLQESGELLFEELEESELQLPSRVTSLKPTEENRLYYTNYQIQLYFNWITNNKNISPSGIVLTSGEWKDKTYNLPKIEYSLDKGFIVNGEISQNIVVSTPVVWPADNYYFKDISRIYKPEEPITYENFCNPKNYNDENKLILPLNNLNYDSGSKALLENYKINSILSDKDGKYIINAVDYGDKKYYDSNRIEITPVDLPADFINNEYNLSIKKDLDDFKIPTSVDKTYVDETHNRKTSSRMPINRSPFVYEFDVAPCMPYGVLELFKSHGSIDFSIINTKSIKLNTWKYYNQDGYSTLTWGFEAYTLPEHFISRVTFEFYDQYGFAAALHVDGKESYNGVFLNTLNFGAFTSYGLNFTKHNGSEGEARKDDPDGSATNGILRNNWLYAVKIYVEYSKHGPFGKYDVVNTDNFYRWFWTSKLFNDYYYQVSDFNDTGSVLNFNGLLNYNQVTEKWEETSKLRKDAYKNITDKTLCYTLQKIDGDSNIEIIPQVVILNNYDVFSLADSFNNEININILMGKDGSSRNPETPAVKWSDKSVNPDIDLLNTTEKDNHTNLGTETFIITVALYGKQYKINQDTDEYIKAENESIIDTHWNFWLKGHIYKYTDGGSIKYYFKNITSESTFTLTINNDCILPEGIESIDSLIAKKGENEIICCNIEVKKEASYGPIHHITKIHRAVSLDEYSKLTDLNKNLYTIELKDSELIEDLLLYVDENQERVELDKYYLKTNTLNNLKNSTLTFKAEHYSYYYYTKAEKNVKCLKIKSFIKNEADLSNYNLTRVVGEYTNTSILNPDNTNTKVDCVCFDKIAAISIKKDSDVSNHSNIAMWLRGYDIQGALTEMKSGKTYYRSDNLVTGMTNKEQSIECYDKNTNSEDDLNLLVCYSNLDTKYKSLAENVTHDFFIPYTYAWTNGTGSGNFDGYLSPSNFFGTTTGPKNEDFTKYGNLYYMFGGLALFKDNKIKLSNPFEVGARSGDFPGSDAGVLPRNSVLVFYGLRWYSLLLNCFYVDSGEYETKATIIDNFVYLDDYYDEIYQDIILNIPNRSASNNLEESEYTDQIIFGTNKLSDLKNAILGKFDNDNNGKDILNKSRHVKLFFNSYLRNCPLKVRFNYVKPEFDYDSVKPLLVDCYDEEVRQKALQADFSNLVSDGTIYALQERDGENGLKYYSIELLTPNSIFKTKGVIPLEVPDTTPMSYVIKEWGRKFKITNELYSQLSINSNGRMIVNPNFNYITTYSAELRKSKPKFITNIENIPIFKDI